MNLSKNFDLSTCDQQTPSVSMNFFEVYLTEMYELCWAVKVVPRSEIFLEEVIVLHCQVLHSTHGFVDAFL